MELQDSRAVDKCLNHMRKKQFLKNICFFFIFSIGHWTSNCEKKTTIFCKGLKRRVNRKTMKTSVSTNKGEVCRFEKNVIKMLFLVTGSDFLPLCTIYTHALIHRKNK